MKPGQGELALGAAGAGDASLTGRCAGVDEVGRGPLAGPVVAAAVVLDPARPIAGLDDSKRLTARRRDALAAQIREEALAWALGRAEAAEVDAVNVLQASLLAMSRAVDALCLAGRPFRPEHVFVDGNRLPALSVPATAVVGGDGRVAEIAAASILAKVTRDAELVELDARYPGYGFASHKGYPSRVHLDALARLGPCAAHRRSFAPVRAVLDGAAAGDHAPQRTTPDAEPRETSNDNPWPADE